MTTVQIYRRKVRILANIPENIFLAEEHSYKSLKASAREAALTGSRSPVAGIPTVDLPQIRRKKSYRLDAHHIKSGFRIYKLPSKEEFITGKGIFS